MNRRVLLLDADPALRASLIQHLAPYRFELAPDQDVEQALAAAAARPPDLLVVAVDEPDKAGFKTFQRCKKGPLSKLPILLVTSSVSADSFAKHKGLKVHADDYIDTRTISSDALVAAIHRLAGAGEPAEPAIDMPLEDDEISLSGDDMVLEETVGDDSDDAGTGAGELLSMADQRVDSMVDVETDAAFAALVGEGEAAPLPPAPPSAPEPGATAWPQLSDAPRDPDEPSVVIAAVPSPIHDNGRPQDSGAHDFDTFSREAMNPPVDLIARAREDHRAHAARRKHPSTSPIPIEVDDLDHHGDEAGPTTSGEPTGERTTVARTSSATLAWPGSDPRAPNAPASAIPDLGLDEIAASGTTTDSSGVFDRRALRKIGDLERQITQLKTELDRARATADAARGANRERDFLNLREQITAKDRELSRARDDARGKERELADARERLRDVEQARAELDARAEDLEQRATADANRAAALEIRDKANANQLATLQQDLDTRGQALAAAEAARVQLERDLAAERALRAAGASDAERALRVEREQLVSRHHGELTAVRNEAATARDGALEALRDELIGEHSKVLAAAVASARAEGASAAERAASKTAAAHGDELAQLKAAHTSALGQLTEERDQALARIASEREAAVAAAEDEHHQVIARLQSERTSELTQARDDAGLQLAHIRDEHATELAHVKQEAESRIAAIMTARDRAVAELVAEVERHKQQLATARSEHEELLGGAAADQAAALDEQAAHHAEQLAQVKAELAARDTQHQSRLAAHREELDEATAQHEHARGALIEEHRRSIDELAHGHTGALAELRDEHSHALADLARQLAEARAAGERTIAEHRAELEQHAQVAARETTDLRTQLVAARRSLDEVAARHDVDRAAAERTAGKALDEQKAQHDRALAAAHGEAVRARSVADAEHQRALTAATAEYDRLRKASQAEAAHQLGELATERDELRRGLSSARDNLKRSEAELATAVATIADRNAELRAHAAAIAERDQRIADLRREIDGIEHENAAYQEQVLRAYQKIKADEVMVARAKKAMAIALTVLDDPADPT